MQLNMSFYKYCFKFTADEFFLSMNFYFFITCTCRIFKTRFVFKLIARLNSGILGSLSFRVFVLSEWNINLTTWDSRASKFISNDTKIEIISWELSIENQIYYFCVGVLNHESDQAVKPWLLVLEKIYRSNISQWHLFDSNLSYLTQFHVQ